MGEQDLENGQTSTDEGTGENPSWQELYSVLPDNLHTLVTPVLEKWEKGTQTQFTQHAEEAKTYEPYKQFIDNNVPADQIEQALAVAQLIDSDPQAFMEQMKAFFGQEDNGQQSNKQQQQQNNEQEPNAFETQQFDLSTDPNFKTIKEQQDIIASYLSQQVEQDRATQEDAALETTLSDLRTKYGDYDEDYVLGLALNGVDPEAAVQRYQALSENIRKAPAFDANVPNIVSPGGGMPSENLNPADMTDKQRQALVMSVLQQANQNN